MNEPKKVVAYCEKCGKEFTKLKAAQIAATEYPGCPKCLLDGGIVFVPVPKCPIPLGLDKFEHAVAQ
jgi:DNA-directed RNA polymerase subunit RPC12/RpoP